MNKKTLLGALFLVTLVAAVPLLQSLFFSQLTRARIKVDHPINAPYLRNSEKPYELVFYGYVGCTKVCTPILRQVSELYSSPSFEPLRPYVGFSFINLMPQMEPDQPQIFAGSFHPAFKGVYLSKRELMSVDREFSLFFSDSLNEPGELNHSDYIYLVKHQKNGQIILKTIYMTHPMNRELIVKDISELLKENR